MQLFHVLQNLGCGGEEIEEYLCWVGAVVEIHLSVALEENKAPMRIAYINAPKGDLHPSPQAEWLGLRQHGWFFSTC